MKSKQKRLAVAALLLGVPLFLAFATAGIVLMPNRSRGRRIEADIQEIEAQIRAGDDARRRIADFERFGRADFERLTAWEGTAVPHSETERDRYEYLRAIEETFGVAIVSVNMGEPKPLAAKEPGSGLDLDGDGDEAKPSPYALLPIEVELDGYFDEVAAALDALQFGPRLAILREMKLAPREGGVVRLHLSYSAVLPGLEAPATNPLAGN